VRTVFILLHGAIDEKIPRPLREDQGHCGGDRKPDLLLAPALMWHFVTSFSTYSQTRDTSCSTYFVVLADFREKMWAGGPTFSHSALYAQQMRVPPLRLPTRLRWGLRLKIGQALCGFERAGTTNPANLFLVLEDLISIVCDSHPSQRTRRMGHLTSLLMQRMGGPPIMNKPEPQGLKPLIYGCFRHG